MALTFRQKALLSTPLPATWMSNVVIHNVYVKFYTDVIGLEPVYVGWVYLAFNVWNIINDPVFGVILDKMRYRPGRGKFLRVMRTTVPFMLLGLVAMAWSDPSWTQSTLLWVFLIELFLFDVASTFYLIATTSYVYLAAPTREDRIDIAVSVADQRVRLRPGRAGAVGGCAAGHPDRHRRRADRLRTRRHCRPALPAAHAPRRGRAQRVLARAPRGPHGVHRTRR